MQAAGQVEMPFLGDLGPILTEAPIKKLVLKELLIYHLELEKIAKSQNPDMGRLEDPVFFDALEVTFTRLAAEVRDEAAARVGISLRVLGAAVEVRLVAGFYRILPVSSPVLQEETVAPALRILGDPRFANQANDFDHALRSLRGGDYSTSIHKAGNAMEGVARVLLEEAGLHPGRNAWGGLRTELAKRGIIPPFLDQILGQETATIRNQGGIGHGAGIDPPIASAEEAGLAVHVAGAVIVYLTARDALLRSQAEAGAPKP
jgi:hypothetical protein